jgi:acetyltransferase-like isoleucine patch superfamily enzyme
MSLLERILKSGMSLKYAGYLWRLLLMKLKYGGRVSSRSLTLSLQSSARLFVEGDSSIRFGAWAHVKRGCDIEAYGGAKVTAGDRFFMNKNSTLVARYGIHIGSDCLIGDHVSIYDHNHEFRSSGAATRARNFRGGEIRIGNNVWIGSKAFIGAGVTIGDNSVIAANSVIVKDVPAGVVAYNRTELAMKPIREAER